MNIGLKITLVSSVLFGLSFSVAFLLTATKVDKQYPKTFHAWCMLLTFSVFGITAGLITLIISL